MENNIYCDQEEFLDYIEHSITNNNKISHAYLIETRSYSDYQLLIKILIKKILTRDLEDKDLIKKIEYQVDNDIYADLKVIYPDGLYIKKEQLLSIERSYSKKSMIDNKMIYVIDQADKLNQSSANTILKFLEEPPENVIAILVVDNKYSVIDTIVSRCQCLSLKNKDLIDDNADLLDFVNKINKPTEILIEYEEYLSKLFFDKNIATYSLKWIEEYLIKNMNKNIEDKSQNKNMNIILMIEEEIKKLQYNLNIKLWFTSFIFRLMEV